MTLRFRMAALAVLALGTAATSAHADTCDTERLPQALETSMQQITSAGQLQKKLLELDGHVSRCPDNPWINLMGAAMDMQVYDAMVQGTNNQITQDSYNYLLRAFARSNAFIAVPAENRRDQLAIPLPSGGVGQLKYEAASTNRRTIIESLMQIARLGSVHPYLAAETPPVCDGWLNSDTQTIGYASKTKADLIFQPFLDGAAAACWNSEEGRLPLAVTAKTYANLVGRDEVTEPEKIRELLEKAEAARDAYLEGRDFDIFYSKFDSGRLDNQLRKHGVNPQAGLLPRDLWFTTQHMRSEKMHFSLAMALSEEWAGIAARMAAGTETQSSAGALYTRFVYAVLNEGREAGLEEETRAALRFALKNVQESVVRAPAMDGQELPPQWLYDVLMNTAAALPGGN
ncbi:MAG: hypothetical protein CVT79_12230 [Alphaproteobacteria bacterium HGW-Alphaproteobacteria-18]|nr:MAG: hypothetical protein CVT79_12230 [Alphaproteobacteria bacterium HGW-Alphaproteobacteria-18]